MIRSAIIDLSNGDFAIYTDTLGGMDSRGHPLRVATLRDALLASSWIEFDATVDISDIPDEPWQEEEPVPLKVRRTIFSRHVLGIAITEEGVALEGDS